MGLWALTGILVVIIVALILKIYQMKRDIEHIIRDFSDRLATDTNTLITVSGSDKSVRRLAANMNGQLRILRKQRHRFVTGDMELKNAIINLSHDLRTPLTAICGYMELLMQEEKSDTVSGYLKIIQNRTDALRHMTDELFQYSVAIAVAEDDTGESVVINNMLSESLAGFYGAFKARAIVPDISMPPKQVTGYLNPKALSRIFGNIINNALKYSDGVLKVVLSENGEITFSNHTKTINALTAERLFDRFYTVETGNHATGLGLSIAKTLTEQMGGQIWAEYKNETLSIIVSFPCTENLRS